MDNFEQTLGYERGIEKRFEEACQKNGWVASAMVAFGRDAVGLRLEKFSKEPLAKEDRENALKALKLFACTEFDILGTDVDPLLKEFEEKIPNTLTPYHVSFDVKVPVKQTTLAAS